MKINQGDTIKVQNSKYNSISVVKATRKIGVPFFRTTQFLVEVDVPDFGRGLIWIEQSFCTLVRSKVVVTDTRNDIFPLPTCFA